MSEISPLTSDNSAFVSEVMHELSEQEETFAQAVVKGYTLTNAARLAMGDSAPIRDQKAYEQARKWRNNIAIRTRILELRRALYEHTSMRLEEGLEVLAAIVRTNLHDLLEHDGTLRQLSEIPEHATHAIDKIKFVQRYERRTVERYDEILGEYYEEEIVVPVSVVSEIDLSSKQQALDKIIKIMGGYKADNEQKAPNVTLLPMDIFENGLDDEEEHDVSGSPAD